MSGCRSSGIGPNLQPHLRQVEWVTNEAGTRQSAPQSEVWVALGSNRDPERDLAQAVDLLREQFGAVRVSKFYRTPAEGIVGPDFLNGVAAFHTPLTALELPPLLKSLEDACGRQRGRDVEGPKGLDIDLLMYGDQVSKTPVLPHPDILQKAYVLGPLADMAPELRHPVTTQTMRELWSQMSATTSPRFGRHQPA